MQVYILPMMPREIYPVYTNRVFLWREAKSWELKLRMIVPRTDGWVDVEVVKFKTKHPGYSTLEAHS
jgi:hypothetical protein